MNIHEYHGKAVLREFGVPVAKGIPALSVEEAVKAARGAGWRSRDMGGAGEASRTEAIGFEIARRIMGAGATAVIV